MKTILKDLVNNKSVLILGFGREGKSTLKLLQEVKSAKLIAIADINELTESVDSSIQQICGPGYLDCLDNFDVVFKSPGIVLPKKPDEYRALITSEVDVFMQAYGHQTIGITGTKGKSTTSALINHILKTAGKETIFGGNIGIPVFELCNQITENTILVIELSCHQLEYARYSPRIAVLLNFYQDHLDHYESYELYCYAKKHIYLNQSADDILFTGANAVPEAGQCPSIVREVTTDILDFNSFDELEGCKLRGKHNLLNVAFAKAVCQEFNVSNDDFKKAIVSFETLPHRLQLIGTLDGVDYYDDSISTTVETAISAVESIENASILIVGGMDRGINYDPLAAFLQNCKLQYILCMYESGKVVYDKLQHYDKIVPELVYTENLENACVYAKMHAPEGSAVIMSPAAASYGVFKNFEDRGDHFKKYIFG